MRPSQVVKSEQEKALDRKAELTKLQKENKRVRFEEDSEDESENKEIIDTDQLNHNLVDLVNNEEDYEPDEFEEVEEDESD